jgi:hypothetical protein
MCFLLITLLHPYPCYYSLHVIIFLHLLSTNYKCTHPCYFPYYSNLLLRRWRWYRILR